MVKSYQNWVRPPLAESPIIAAHKQLEVLHKQFGDVLWKFPYFSKEFYIEIIESQLLGLSIILSFNR